MTVENAEAAADDAREQAEENKGMLADLLQQIQEAVQGGASCAVKPGEPGAAAGKGMCVRASTEASRGGREAGKKDRVDKLTVQQRVRTLLGEADGQARDVLEGQYGPRTHTELTLRLDNGEGDRVDMVLVRRNEWVQEARARVGGVVYVEELEQGAVGWARVLEMEPCREPEPGPGRLITGIFRHSRGAVIEVQIEGEKEPLGITPGHPIWSVDRLAWVPAGELREGERLEAADGTTPRVLSMAKCAEPEPVYNIEVDGDHCYRIGTQGLLVHNASLPVVKFDAPIESYKKVCAGVRITQPFESDKPHPVAGFVVQHIRFMENIPDCCNPANAQDIATYTGGIIPGPEFYEWWDAIANQILFENDDNNLVIKMDTKGKVIISGTFRFCEGQPTVQGSTVKASGALGSSVNNPVTSQKCGSQRARKMVIIMWDCCDPKQQTTDVTFK